MSKSKRRRARYQPVAAGPVRPSPSRQRSDDQRRMVIIVGALAGIAAGILLFVVFVLPSLTGAAQGTPHPSASVGPPAATPLANPPAEPAGDGTTATIETPLGNIVIELYNESAPVAAQNFENLAEAGFYDGVVFHRIVPDFVIQGGDPQATGGGGPGYSIPDEPVVGEYGRGIVAMARTDRPNSAGSQFFIVLSDNAHDALEYYRTYVIFGKVVSGMDVVDRIGAMPNSGPPDNRALDPVAMTRVTIQRP
jgi:peptidyl-prolyl cis-trans isomerase B (cyclophilin B)